MVPNAGMRDTAFENTQMLKDNVAFKIFIFDIIIPLRPFLG